MFPTPNHPADPDAYSVTVEPTTAAKGGIFALNMDGNWERVARAHRPEVINSIAPAPNNYERFNEWPFIRLSRAGLLRRIEELQVIPQPKPPINKTLLGMVVTSGLISLLTVAGIGGMLYWAFSK